MSSIHIEWQCKFGRSHHCQTKQYQADAYRVAQRGSQPIKIAHNLCFCLDRDYSLLGSKTLFVLNRNKGISPFLR